MQAVNKDDIQDQLIERLQEEKRLEALRRKERNEAHLFINMSAYTEDGIMTHKGIDLINTDRTPCFSFKINKNSNYRQAIETIAEQMNYPPDGIRLWPFITRNNHSYRPVRVSENAEICNSAILDSSNNCSVFVETISPKLPLGTLPISEKDGNYIQLFYIKQNISNDNLLF